MKVFPMFLFIFQFDVNKETFVFTEWESKSNPGGLRCKSKKPKSVTVFKSKNKDRCVVEILLM